MMGDKTPKKLRIAVSVNAPYCPSGYGQQALQFLPKMVEAGYPTACIAFFGLEGGIIKLDGVTMYPKIASQWGDDAMVHHSKHFNADVVFTLQDIWVLNPDTFRQLAGDKRRWIPILPVDHEPMPPAIKERVKLAYRVISYAPFGTRELQAQGFHSTYIPHTVDTKLTKKYDKKEARKMLGIPEDTFLFGMVAANKDNPPRKSFQEVMDAFKMFHDKHPNSMLYLHSLADNAGGFQLRDYANLLGIEKQVVYGNAYDMLFLINQEKMAQIYSAMDVLLIPSQNEGFGVPIIEALACEVPVITTDFTAMRDLVEDGVTGYKVKVLHKRFTPLLSYVAYPDTEDLYNKMEQIYTDDREKMGKAGREFVVKNFDLDTVWKERWVPFLDQLSLEVYGE